ncbi:MAG: hypothetical protein GY870_06745 [archaeon]|nr:hypothetical protein [archaeon]
MAKEATIKININTKNAIGSIDELNNEFNGTLSTIQDLRIASQKLSEELESTPVGTDKFKQLQGALIDVNGQLKNYELSIEALDNEQLASEIRSVVGGVMDLVSGLTLLGVSDENIEKIAQKFAKLEGISRAATGAMDIYNSGAKVMNSILTKSAAAQEVLAAATAASGAASAGAATKFRALTAAMLSNPFTAIAVAIAAVVSALVLFSDEQETAAEKTQRETDELEKQNKELEEQYNKRMKLLLLMKNSSKKQSDNIELLKAQGKSEKEIYDAESDLVKKLTEEHITAIKLRLAEKEWNLLKLKNLTAEEIKDQGLMTEKELEIYNTLIQRKKVLDATEQKRKDDESDKAYKKRIAEAKKIEEDRNKLEADLYSQFLLEKENLENEYLDGLFTNQEREENAVRDKYFTLLQQAEEYGEEQVQILKDAQQEELDAIDEKYKKQAEIEKANTAQINSEIELLELEHQKQLELLEADKIDNEEEKQQAILNIKKKYFQLEIDAINNSIQKQKDLLTEQFNQEISNEELTAEEKERIKAEYNSNIIKLDQDRELKIAELENDTIENLTTQLETKLNKYSEFIGKIGEFITQSVQILDDFLSEKSAQETARIEEQNTQAKNSLKNRLDAGLIDREQYDNAINTLDEQKQQKEKELAHQAFKRQKALQIINATIQGAQAVLAAYSSGASVPIIGPITTGPAYAAIAGALAAAQIGIIASQKFRASKGGKVPGQPSSVDSVDALLAPGETVINSRSSEMFAPLLSAINELGGGIPLAPSANLLTPKSTTIYSDNVGMGAQTVRAYVVEQDISYSQNRVNRLRNNARFS